MLASARAGLLGTLGVGLALWSCNAVLGIDERDPRPAAGGSAQGGQGQGGSQGGAGATGGAGGQLAVNGTACAEGTECASNHCTDGVCCESACAGPCEACASDGSCAPHVGSDPEGDCAAGVCDGQGSCVVGEILGQRSFGSPATDLTLDVAMLDGEATVVSIYTEGPIDMGTGLLAELGLADVVLATYDLPLVPAWSQRFGTASWELGNTVNRFPLGGFILGGQGSQPIDFGGGPVGNGVHAFWALFGAGGNHVVSQSWTGNGDQGVLDAAIVGPDAIYVLTFSDTAMDFGSCSQPAGADLDYDLVLARLDQNANAQWCRSYEVGWDGEARYRLAADQSSVYVVGSFTESAEVGCTQNGSAGGADGFVMRLEPNGNTSWARCFGGAGDQRARGVAVASNGDAVVVGDGVGTIGLGSSNHTTAADHPDGFVVRLSPNGDWSAPLWVGTFPVDDTINAVAVDSADHVIVAGQYSAPTSIGALGLDHMAATDGFVAMLSTGLEPLWAQPLQGSGNVVAAALSVGDDGHIVVGGHHSGSLEVGGQTFVSQGGWDAYLVVLSP